jgi:hypothetical protein
LHATRPGYYGYACYDCLYRRIAAAADPTTSSTERTRGGRRVDPGVRCAICREECERATELIWYIAWGFGQVIYDVCEGCLPPEKGG